MFKVYLLPLRKLAWFNLSDTDNVLLLLLPFCFCFLLFCLSLLESNELHLRSGIGRTSGVYLMVLTICKIMSIVHKYIHVKKFPISNLVFDYAVD